MSEQTRSRRPAHGMGGGRMAGEKPKDFKKAIGKMLGTIASYRVGLIFVMVFAIGSTVFNILGPKILSKATDELFNGLVLKVQGLGGIDFGKVGQILLFLLGMYALSASFSFIQGWIMSGISQKVSYQ